MNHKMAPDQRVRIERIREGVAIVVDSEGEPETFVIRLNEEDFVQLMTESKARGLVVFKTDFWK